VLTLSIIFFCLCIVASLPYWLPSALVGLRMRIFTGINGEEGISIPGELVDSSQFKQVYSHPAANGRSRGAALSDLFWYWLSPGPEVHQEHLEPGRRYEDVARTTRRILAVPKDAAEELAAECVSRVIASQNIGEAKLVRLRDLMMPVWAGFYYELVFGERCPPAARDLIVDNANDVVTALKCCSLRHMEKRHRLTRFLIGRLQERNFPHELPRRLSREEQAFYLQGTFFNTAVVQMSEAMVHLLMVLAQNEELQLRLAENGDERYLDWVLAETLRLYPLFGISHRITSAPIKVDEGSTIPTGSVLCFNHSDYHHTGFDNPESFAPERWEKQSVAESNYIPFGVMANRPCPAQGLAPITMKAVVRELLKHFTFHSSASHTRSIPSRGPCLLESKACNTPEWKRRSLLNFIRLRDRWEDVWRSVIQLVLGTYMVWDARRQRLCQGYFEASMDNAHAEQNHHCPSAPNRS
jgi:hypothetical protein